MTEFKEKAKNIIQQKLLTDSVAWEYLIETALTEAYEKGLEDAAKIANQGICDPSCCWKMIRDGILALKPPRPKNVYLKCPIHKTDLLSDGGCPYCNAGMKP